MSPEDRRYAALVAEGLAEPDIIQVGQEMYWRNGPKRRVKRRPSLTRAIKTARKAGVERGSVTVGDVTVSFGEADPAAVVNPWLADLDKVMKQ